ncbi:hypothetical protein T08_15109 [Trichinella sp. T8]|nr:hypothetical protein T08_15109 [Trichinella sp. T8]
MDHLWSRDHQSSIIGPDDPMCVCGSEHRQDFEAILGNGGGQSRTVIRSMDQDTPMLKKKGELNLLNNVESALRRLGAVEVQLARDPARREQYASIIQNYLKNGWAENVDEVEQERCATAIVTMTAASLDATSIFGPERFNDLEGLPGDCVVSTFHPQCQVSGRFQGSWDVPQL